MREALQTIRRVRARYRDSFGHAPNVFKPRRFSEKIQWRKLFDHNPLFTILSDKLAVRDVLKARIADEHIIPLQWSGLPEDIPFATLAYPCVLKSNHASGQVEILTQRDDARRDEIVREARAWLATNYGSLSDEPGYCDVPPRLMIETKLTDDAGGVPEERRMFVFDGVVRCINTVFREDEKVRNGAFHTPQWERLDWRFSRWVARDFPRPQRLDDMIAVAERLGQGLDHVRIDIFDCGSRFYVGETTLYSWSGLSPFTPDEADVLLGAHWRIRRPLLRAIAATLANRHPRRSDRHAGA